ncbi:MAG: SMP-30/gluconolactonase/LRE family protein [Pseudomonadota bacterium]
MTSRGGQTPTSSNFRVLADGLRFPEGPLLLPDGDYAVVEIARGTLTRVTPDGVTSVIAELGGGPNGAALGPDGRVYICNNGGFQWHERGGRLFPGDEPENYSTGRIERVDLATGAVEVLYTHCQGQPLRGPNDLVFDDTGGFWFTDHGKSRPRERDVTGVFYAHADGSSITEVVFPMHSPNGIGLSPSGDTLYVAETPTGRLWAFPLDEPGTIARRPSGSLHRRLIPGRSGFFMFDSLAVEASGRVCVATLIDGGITCLDPTESSPSAPEFVPFPDPLTTNICFVGEGLNDALVTLSSTGQLVCTPWSEAGLKLSF